MNGYNGWTNRETWLVNLHFGDSEDYIADMAKDADYDLDTFADSIRNMVYDYVEEQTLNPFISDLMNLSSIDWRDLAESWMADYQNTESDDE